MSPSDANNGAAPGETPASGRPGTVAGQEPGAQVRAIARAVDRNSKRTDEVIARVRQLAGDVATLAALVPTDRATSPAATATAPAAATSGPPPVRSWLLADDSEQAISDLAELLAWLDRVYLCFPDALLGSCWMWHPHVVEELWWLCQAHAEAYDPEIGSWLRVGDWHDRQRPGVARRVRELLVKCDLSLHAPERQHGRPLPRAAMTGAASAVAVAWTRERTRPIPTAEQLDEARAHDTDQPRRR